MMDDKKVDFIGLPFHIQAKKTQGSINYDKLLGEMPKNQHRAIIHSRNNSELVIMNKEFFYELIRKEKNQTDPGISDVPDSHPQ